MDKIYYGEETKKAVNNFGMEQMPHELIRAYAEVKKAVLSAVQEYEQLFEASAFDSILVALDAVIRGDFDSQFLVPLKQGGAGTSINMNLNEVAAGIANENLLRDHPKIGLLDPIKDINRFQSTNDTFPTAVVITVFRKLEELEKNVIELQETLIRKEAEYSTILMAGRTEMQSAIPITLGQVFASWAGGIERDRWRLNKLKERIRTIPLGGAAVGTGFPIPQPIVFLSEKNLRQITGLPLSRSQNLTDEVSSQDKLSELADGIRLCADNLFKMTGDLLIYTSSIAGEIIHPELQYGSTIMPAKTNPVVLEFARGLSIDAIHETNKISEFCRNGQLQLNAYLPFILDSFLKAFDSLNKAVLSLIGNFFSKMEINRERIEKNLIDSNVMLNLLLPVLDYHEIKALFTLSEKERPASLEGLKKLILKNTGLSEAQLNSCFDPVNATTFGKGK